AVVQASAYGDSRPEFKLTVDAFNRVSNLAAKAAGATADPALFAEAAESELLEAWQKLRPSVHDALESGDIAAALQTLASLKPLINAYFDKVMVMSPDETVRNNRLSTLAGISQDIAMLADFSKLVW